jgi:hypothetical protein
LAGSIGLIVGWRVVERHHAIWILILLIRRKSAKWRLDWSNARSRMTKNFGKLSVEGLKFVYSMVKKAGFVEENGMDLGGLNVIGKCKG